MSADDQSLGLSTSESTPAEKITQLLGYSVDIVQVRDGWVAEWLNYNSKPPPVRETKEEAELAFLEFLEGRSKTLVPDFSSDTRSEL